MLPDSAFERPLSGDGAAQQAAMPATTFKPLVGAHGPSHDQWLQVSRLHPRRGGRAASSATST